eukprot:7523805-Ditylum_brightwellii.AAC.1
MKDGSNKTLEEYIIHDLDIEALERSLMIKSIGKWFIICNTRVSSGIIHFIDKELPDIYQSIVPPAEKIKGYDIPRRPLIQ